MTHRHHQAPGDPGQHQGGRRDPPALVGQQDEQHAEEPRQAQVHADAGKRGLGLEPEPRAGGRLLKRDVEGGPVQDGRDPVERG